MNSDIGSMTSGETLDVYCSFFREFEERVGLSSPYVVAHSFGGFLFTHCASKYPYLASNILLANVPGFFPNNGGLDYSFAFYFSFGLPQSFLKLLMWGSFGETALIRIADKVGLQWTRSMLSYWHEFHMSPHLQSGGIVSKFVKFKYFNAGAENVALVPLLNMTTPVSLLYGENDPISPSHQGIFISSLAEGTHISNLYIIPDIGHMPFLAKAKSKFIDMVIDADRSRQSSKFSMLTTKIEVERKASSISAEKVAACLQRKSLEWATYSCLPIAYFSEINRKNMYKTIKKIEESCN